MSWFKNSTGAEFRQLLPPRIREKWKNPFDYLFRPFWLITQDFEAYKDDVRLRTKTLASTGLLEFHIVRLIGATRDQVKIYDQVSDVGVDFIIKIKPIYEPQAWKIKGWVDTHKLVGKTYLIQWTYDVQTPPDFSKLDYSAEFNINT